MIYKVKERFHRCCTQLKISTKTSVASNQATVTGFGATFWPENHDDQPILPDTLQVGNVRRTFGFFFVQELDEVWTVVSSEECVSWVEKQIELGKNFSSEW